MRDVSSLVDRPVYGFGQVDRILGLTAGTARRWIDGYRRAGRTFAPVVRPAATGNEIVTWGEFVETRLLSEFRHAGVRMGRMRPAIDRLRDELGVAYPLTSARIWLVADGGELVRRIQDEVGLDSGLAIVVRNRQGLLDWSAGARDFEQSVNWTGPTARDEVRSLRPVAGIAEVEIDPLRSFGEPVVRGVPTEVIAELVRAGDSPDMIAELYELPRATVEAAVRYELIHQAA